VSADIVLCTLNARWAHASFGLRCLKANLGPLAARCTIIERTLEHRAVDVVADILAHEPRVVGLGVYVWNAVQSLEIVRALKKLAPDVVVVVGGPEVSHEADAQEICARADVVVAGEGEDAFRAVCERVLGVIRSDVVPATLAMAPAKLRDGGRPDLARLALPYALYDDVDVRDRVVYVEASRGCPFTCSFCLSALDDGVRTFPLDAFLAEMGALVDRGLRQFKFVDRTFNLKIDDAARILDFFLARMTSSSSPQELFVHFEMIPDRLPDALRSRLARFPSGSVQLEVGIQSFDEKTGALIRRRQDAAKIEENLRFLAEHTGCHVHADLIAGLPEEDLAAFARSFDRLYALAPSEIQVGILKRLRGAPLAKDVDEHPEWGVIFDDSPPYQVLATRALPFADVQKISRFARAYDLVHNSGRFPRASRMITGGGSPFAAFLRFSEWLFRETGGARHGIALGRLSELVRRFLVDELHVGADDADAALVADLGRDKAPHLPERQARHRSA
jgi:radical SAM superfamily enzyme YgiQ (UPF0313 family)